MGWEGMPSWEVVGSVSYTPSRKQVRVLVEALALEGDAKRVKDIERALLRQPQAAWASGARALGAEAGEGEGRGKRGRLCKLLGRLLDEQGVGEIGPLVGALRDREDGVRKAAARALGKRWRAPGEERAVMEGALLEALAQEAQPLVEAALVEALGRVGGEQAAAALETRQGQAVEAARLLLRRNLSAQQATAGAAGVVGAAGEDGAAGEGEAVGEAVGGRGAVRDDVPLAQALVWTWRCRSGLEQVLERELAAVGVGEVSRVRRGEVEGRLPAEAALGWGWRSRVATGFGLSLRPQREGSGAGVVDALVQALSSAQVEGLLRRVAADPGAPVRYRLSAAVTPRDEGRTSAPSKAPSKALNRAQLLEVVRRLAAGAPWLVNDPSLRGWEVEASAEQGGSLGVWLSPRLVDPRFAYRRGDVPAASHPTMAAALAFVAAPRAGDVVWDPFAGSGGEVIECGLRGGREVTLIGSDLSQGALETAAQNAAAANLTVTWQAADALRWCPRPRPTLIVTNPPMGRRVKLADGLDAFFAQCLDAFARALAPGGRVVWFAPRGRAVAAAARRRGWRVSLDQPVDMGGFEVHIQALTAPSG
jgi:23S rRNA G2445 N2-methylase RlmL